jgi:hypothetical protein
MLGKSKLAELPPPDSARSAKEANEVCRAWVVDGGLHVSMQRSFDDPALWGLMLADVARHAARIYEAEGDMTFEQAMARIGSLFRAEMESPTDMGSTSPQ